MCIQSELGSLLDASYQTRMYIVSWSVIIACVLCIDCPDPVVIVSYVLAE